MPVRVCVVVLAGILLTPAAASAQWEVPSRAFHKATAFPLDGKHLAVACADCHVRGQMKGTPTTCADCHWVRRQDDRYRTRLGMSCEQCHRTTTWTAVKWDHAAQTGTPLSAPHRSLGCDSCHRNSVFSGTSPTCVSCHAQDYAAARTPDHRAAGFPTTCEVCHKPADTTFQQGRFDHSAVFPLSGMHATAACANCHVNGVYLGTPRTCFGCHRTDYERTTSPNHAAAGYSTTCEGCHKATDSSWLGAAFNHNSVFQLVGRHATIVCSACHVNNVFKGTPTTCAPCHLADYQKTTNPNHTAAGFPVTCDACHKAADVSWSQGKFTHTWFPITSGQHRNIACATCHINSASYAQFSCLTSCHGRAQTDNQHRNRNGYSYDSVRCYACHPTGRGN